MPWDIRCVVCGPQKRESSNRYGVRLPIKSLNFSSIWHKLFPSCVSAAAIHRGVQFCGHSGKIEGYLEMRGMFLVSLGIVSRFPGHLEHFTPAYYEVKGVNGVWHDTPAGSIPMVSIFGDDRLGERHPEWLQMGPDGELATRQSRYFDWAALCPSRAPVFELGLEWVQTAHEQSGGQAVRLDDVTFAREGFCQCEACQENVRQSGQTLETYRVDRIIEFVQAAHKIAPRLEFTLFPDPFPGHLARRFGVDPMRLAPYVDTFVVPIYDLHYATTYWLEVLAQAFDEILPGRRWLIELYGLQVPEEALLHACQVASFYADGVVVAYDNQLEKLLRIQERLNA